MLVSLVLDRRVEEDVSRRADERLRTLHRIPVHGHLQLWLSQDGRHFEHLKLLNQASFHFILLELYQFSEEILEVVFVLHAFHHPLYVRVLVEFMQSAIEQIFLQLTEFLLYFLTFRLHFLHFHLSDSKNLVQVSFPLQEVQQDLREFLDEVCMVELHSFEFSLTFLL